MEVETGVRYTQSQWDAIQRVREHLDSPEPPADSEDAKDQDPDLTNALMDLCMLVVMQDTSRISLYESPMMHYLAMRGVDETNKTFYSSFGYTKILAAALWINRLLLLEVAVPSEPWLELGLESKAQVASVRDRIDEIRKKHLCEGSFSPTSSILTQLAMGKHLNKMHQSQPNIYWSEDGQTIFLDGKGIELGRIRTMCHTLTQELSEGLRELTFGSPVPGIKLDKIVDSVGWGRPFRQLNFTFSEHAENKEHTDVGYRYLYKRARKGEGGWKLLRKNKASQRNEWMEAQVKKYLTKERQFLRKLMVCMHIMGGQPARGPELGSVKIRNSLYSARNIYILNGRATFLTMYDKARRRRGNTEYILRCLPDELSQILVQYLVYVSPFARALPLDRRESEYLFGDLRGPWAGEELSQTLAQQTSKHLGVRLTASKWRHVAIGIATRHLMRASRTWEIEDEDDDLENEVDDFATGDDEEELALDTFRHVLIR
jgi:hypothetical protein